MKVEGRGLWSGQAGTLTLPPEDLMEGTDYHDDKKDLKSQTRMDIVKIPNFDSEFRLGSSENQKSDLVVKQREKYLISTYLNFFETSPDEKSQKCKFCNQIYPIATAIGNLGRHLSHCHPGYDQTEDTIQQSSPTVTTEREKSLLQVNVSISDPDHLNWVLLKCLIGVSGSSSFDDELLNSLRFLNPSAQIWPREKFHAMTLQVYGSMRNGVIETVHALCSKVSLSLDLWTSCEQVLYLSVKAHWIDANWSLHKVLLDIVQIPYPCSGSNIYLALMKLLKMFNLEKRILSCTADGSQAAVYACRALKEEMVARKAPFCYMPCAAQSLLSMIEDCLRPARHVLSKIREFALQLNSLAQIAKDFTQTAATYKEGSWKFPVDASASWAGDYAMLDLVAMAPITMDTLIRKHEALCGGLYLLLSPAEISIVGRLHRFLEPFHKASTDLCSCKVPTVGLTLFFMDHISAWVTTHRSICRHVIWLNTAVQDISKRAQNFIGKVYNPLIYMATMLDPRIRKELAPEFLDTEKNLNDARAHFLQNYHSGKPQACSTAGNSQGARGITAGGWEPTISFAEEIAYKRRKATGSTPTDELGRYLSEPTTPFTVDPLEWWKVNSPRYPRLSLMARDFLAIQGTTVDPEEIFTCKAATIQEKRLALPYGYAQAVLCIQSWLESGYKLKLGSSEIHFDRNGAVSASAAADDCSVHLGRKPR